MIDKNPFPQSVVVPVDDDARPFSDSLLPEAMIYAGSDALDKAQMDMANYVSGETIDWDQGMMAVAVYRAMLAAAPAPSSLADGEVQTLRTLLDNLVIAQGLSKEIRTHATDEARAYLYDTRLAALSPEAPARGEAAIWAKVEEAARRYARCYPEASDGRNTFVMFAEWAASEALTPAMKPQPRKGARNEDRI